MRKLTKEQIKELEDGDGVYYIAQEAAMAPGIAGVWPSVIPSPQSKNGRLVKRVVTDYVCNCIVCSKFK